MTKMRNSQKIKDTQKIDKKDKRIKTSRALKEKPRGKKKLRKSLLLKIFLKEILFLNFEKKFSEYLDFSRNPKKALLKKKE